MPEIPNNAVAAERRKLRRAVLVDAHRGRIETARVIVIGEAVTPWCRACLDADAAGVICVEIGPEGESEPAPRGAELRRAADPQAALEDAVREGACADVVILIDALTNIRDLHRLFRSIRQLGPGCVLGDGVFGSERDPVFLPGGAGIIPSVGAIEMVARETGFSCTWLDWSVIPEGRRVSVSDYFQPGPRRRAGFRLEPFPQDHS